MLSTSRKQHLLEAAAQQKWFHAIEFGESRTSGRFPEVPPETPLSKARFTGTPGDEEIDWATYTPDFFPHPDKDLPALGSAVWMNKNHNFWRTGPNRFQTEKA